MTKSLYGLTEDAIRLETQIREQAELLFSDDPGEVNDARDELEGLLLQDNETREALYSKADTWCWVIDRMRATVAERKAHAKRLQALAKYDEDRADALEEKLISLLTKVQPDSTGFELPGHKITSRKTAAVEVDVLASDLPEQFQRVVTRVDADKEAIKAAIKAGELVHGARLVERRSWTIK